MPESEGRSTRTSARLRRGAVIAALAGVLALLALVSIPVSRNIQALATANSDNVQWTLAQVEVEYFSFKTALSLDVATDVVDLAEVRRRFDVFYSRIGTLERAQVFAPLREDVGFRAALESIRAFLDGAVPLIDASDSRLLVGRRALLEQTAALRPEVRALALGGLERFAELSDGRRVEVLDTLRLTAGLVLGLIGVLLVALVVLLQFFQEGARQARALRLTTSRLDAIVSNSLAAIFVTDKDGRVLDYNGAAEEMFGYTRAEVLGQDLARWIVPSLPDGTHAEVMGLVLGQGRVRITAQRKSGAAFPAEVSAAAVQSEEGEIYITFLRDVSDQVAANRAMREARDKAIAGERAKADLLAVMSHEMRTPLNGLLGTLDLMGQTDLTPEQAGYVRNMLISGQLLLHHVGDVLDIARLEAGTVTLTPVDFELSALLTDLADSQRPSARAAGNRLLLDLPDPGPIWLHGDAMRLRQVLLNLLGNAIKFTEGGTITLSAERESEGRFVFRVTDTGIGIAAEDQARVFEDFVTLDASYGRQAGGTGLGLGITRRILQAMGGEIGLDSAPGVGSTFHVRLSLPETTAPAPPALTPPPPAAPARPMDILLVEDNEINQSVAVALLERSGHRVTVASDGQEGVQAAGERGFDLVLMDISMPRMDGVTATRLIRDGAGPNAGTPIVALTANALPEDEARFREAGMEDVLTKPIRADTLAQMLARWQGARAEPASDADAAPGLDANVLTELHGLLGPAHVTRMLDAIDGQVADACAALAKPGAAEDAAAQVHKLAGAVALLGAIGLTERLRAAETALKAGQSALAPSELTRLWHLTRAQIVATVAADSPARNG